MRAHLTVEQRQLAFRLKARGLSLREIGPQVGCSHQGIVTCFPSISRALRVSSGNDLRPPLTSSLRKHSGQRPRARQRAWPGYGAIPCTVRAVTRRTPGAAGHRRRVRPRTVEDQRQSAVTVANAVAKPLDKARPMRTAVERRPSAASATDDPGRYAQLLRIRRSAD
jgi:hypothetical protein